MPPSGQGILFFVSFELVDHGVVRLLKARVTVKVGDFAGLGALAKACLDRFALWVVLCDSADVVPFGDKSAVPPLSYLWS
ncbi:Uncharacterised protein [Burkholderia pseudomallei]|nr:Uncharacterised protein [Burkholderia pseudomallei]CAJ8195160.1 Uncharacterised protein [Burkholderia pseudomallei]CAJ8935214.1 Uncharacterised protein [Burkholderia pseudomallei]